MPIQAEIARLNPEDLGVRIKQLDRFKREITATSEVQQCYHVTGAMELF